MDLPPVVYLPEDELNRKWDEVGMDEFINVHCDCKIVRTNPLTRNTQEFHWTAGRNEAYVIHKRKDSEEIVAYLFVRKLPTGGETRSIRYALIGGIPHRPLQPKFSQ
jgi:hypothetical protein